jgi:hypothetical protein
MRFVLGNRLMTLAGGTESHLVTLGDELLRLGHEVVVYAPELGPFADFARDRGLGVVDRVRELPAECDVVFAQDSIVVYDLVERYPDALTVFRICGDVYDFQSPPQLEGVVDLVVVLSDRYERLARACAVNAPILRLRIPVDIDRLTPIGGIRARPERVVVLGNYTDRIDMIRSAWEPRGIEVVQVGGTKQRYDIANALEGADIVVAKSRAALDAMACGRAVYVLDTFGGDGWVTLEAYQALETDHFAGQATARVIGAAELQRDLDDYDAGMGEANRDLVVQHHRARDHAIELLAALQLQPRRERPPAPLRELARLTTLQWSWERFAREGQAAQAELYERLVRSEQAAADVNRERAELRDRLVVAERAAAEASANAERVRVEVRTRAGEAEALRTQLDAIQETRAWRLCNRYWRWRDRLSGRPRAQLPGR